MAPCVLFADEIEKALAGASSSGQTDSGAAEDWSSGVGSRGRDQVHQDMSPSRVSRNTGS